MDSTDTECLIGSTDQFVVSKTHIKQTLEDLYYRHRGKETNRNVILNEIEGNEYYPVCDGMFMLEGSPPKAYAYFNSQGNKLVFLDLRGEHKYTFDHISGVVEDPQNSDWDEPSPRGYRSEDYSLLSLPPIPVRTSGHPGTAVYHWEHQWAKGGVELVDNVSALSPRGGWDYVESVESLRNHAATDDPSSSVKVEFDGVPSDDHNNLEIEQDDVTVQVRLTPRKAIELYGELGEAISNGLKGVTDEDVQDGTRDELREDAIEASRQLTLEPFAPDDS